MLIPCYSPASFSSLTLGFTSAIPDWRDWVGVACLLVFISPSVLPVGMKLQEKCLEMKDGRDETKIWTKCPGAGQAKEPQFFPYPVLSKLTHPLYQSGCCFRWLPFSTALRVLSPVPCSRTVLFCRKQWCQLWLPGSVCCTSVGSAKTSGFALKIVILL